MPDISMCADGKDCPEREGCYRFKAKPHPYWQAYMSFYKHREPDAPCPAFMQLWDRSDTPQPGASR